MKQSKNPSIIWVVIHSVGAALMLSTIFPPRNAGDVVAIGTLSGAFGVVWTFFYTRFWNRIIR